MMLVAGGQAVSLLGSHGVQFALIWWLAVRSNSALMLGAAGLVAYLPQVLFGPLAGLVADRFDQRKVSATADISMGLLALLYAILLTVYSLPAWTVLIVLAVRGVGDTFQEPAIQSLIPKLVPTDELVHTNGWLQLLRGGAFLFGPPIGALLYATLPLPWVLISDIFGAAIASTTLLMVSLPATATAPAEVHFNWHDWLAGLNTFRRQPNLLIMLIADAITMSLYAPLASLYPLMTSGYFKLSAIFGSAIEFSFATGMLLSSLLFATILHVKRHLQWSRGGLAFMGLATIIGGTMPPTFTGWVGFAMSCALLALAGNLHSIPLMAYIQTIVPAEELGRALSAQTMINGLTMPIGLLIASPIANVIGVNHWFIVAGLGMLSCFVATSYYFRRHQK